MRIDTTLRSKLKKKVLLELKSTQKRSVTVKSSIALSESSLASVGKLYGSDVIITNVVDSSILGGLIIEDGSKIIDYSMKNFLDETVQSLLTHSHA